MASRIKRKFLSLALSALIASSLILSSGVAAAQGASDSKDNVVTVIINGVKQNYAQPALTVNGRTLVPLRGIFEALGAKVEWNAADEVARGIKGETEILVQLGNKSAYVNGVEVKLEVPAQSINGSTMVPLRFISESLGAEVKWSGDTNTATIISGGSGGKVNPGSGVEQGQVKYGSDYWKYGVQIKVRYGDHDYGVRSQKEYDESMKIVDQALQTEFDSTVFGGKRLHDYAMRYLDGDRASNYEYGSDEYISLTLCAGYYGDLVKAGVDKSTIMEVSRLQGLALGYTAHGRLTKEMTEGSPRSIYDNIVSFYSDCDSSAQTLSAFFDAKGYSTAIVAGNGHAEAYVKINGTWFWPCAGSFEKVSNSLESLSFRPGKFGNIWLMSKPTF